jgi:hypothetical protein
MSGPQKVKLTRQEVAQHVRTGALRITCAACKGHMQPDEQGWMKCPDCGKAMGAGDRTEALRDIRPHSTNKRLS